MPAELSRVRRQAPSFACSVPGCNASFTTKEECEDHKMTDGEHFICDKCEGFSCLGWENKLKHLVQSDNHIACPKCGKEFGSTGGMKLHVRKMHPGSQKLYCPGCVALFRSASTLIEHLEKGECKKINQTEFQDHVNHKTIITNLLAPGSTKNIMSVKPTDPDSTHGSTRQSQATSDTSSELGGGVGITDLMSSNPDSVSQQAGSSNMTELMNTPQEGPQDLWPTLKPVPSQAASSRSDITKGSDVTGGSALTNQSGVAKGFSRLSLISYPDSDPEDSDGETSKKMGRAPVAKEKTPARPNISGAFAAALQERNNEYVSRYGGTSAPASGPELSTAKVPPSQSQVHSGDPFAGNKFTTKYWSPTSTYWNVENFFNTVINRYECPHPGCDWNTASPNRLKGHCMTLHKASTYRCPGCIREFKDLSSLVRHCESPSVRCDVRNTRGYAKFIDQITGGYIDATGTHEEGGIKYQATRPREFDEDQRPQSEQAGEAEATGSGGWSDGWVVGGKGGGW